MNHVLRVALPLTLVGCAVPHTPSPTVFPRDSSAPAARAMAQDPAPATPGQRSAPIGIGFTEDPDTLLLGAAVDFPAGDNWTIGPGLHLGVDDDGTLVAPIFQAKRFFPIDSPDDGVRRLLPFVAGGAGIAWFQLDNAAGDDDDMSLLLQLGGGLRYRLADRVTLGSQMGLNFLPGEVFDEDFYFSWEVVQFVLTF